MSMKKTMRPLFVLFGVVWAVSGCQMEKQEETAATETVSEAASSEAVSTEIVSTEAITAENTNSDTQTDMPQYQRLVYTGENENWKFTYEVTDMVYLDETGGKLEKKHVENHHGSAFYQKSLDELNKTQHLEIIWSNSKSGSSSTRRDGPFSSTEFHSRGGVTSTSYLFTADPPSTTVDFGEDEDTQIHVIVSQDEVKKMVTLNYYPQPSEEPVSFLLVQYGPKQDGTWRSEDDYTYQYRLELTGRIPNAAGDTTFVVLSNREDITFEEAWKASGLSSNTKDFFQPEDAVIVEVRLP